MAQGVQVAKQKFCLLLFSESLAFATVFWRDYLLQRVGRN
jgi:hypothetical protein